MSGEYEQTHLLEWDVPWANVENLALIWISVTVNDNWDGMLLLLIETSSTQTPYKETFTAWCDFLENDSVLASLQAPHWPPFISALPVKTTRSTRWCCDIHHDRDPHIHIINTPSLYYQIFLKHLFATANTAELFRVSTTKKTRLPCLLEFSLLIKTIFKCLCAVYSDRTRALHRHFPDIPFVFFSIK